MKSTMLVPKSLADQLEEACRKPLEDTGRGEVLFDREYVFEDGTRMAIQVIASEEPDKESCWTQGVLFDQAGNELGCTNVGESFLGEYFIQDYVVDVKATEHPWVIINQQEEYWSNSMGWVDKGSATVFDVADIGKLNLPLGGKWVSY